ncbi:MAG: 4Fe-4S binding protein [Symbiobacteriaceae bacterium]|nr:4Fe-4S binding protein [Symbiobacteriaceae bacterium]
MRVITTKPERCSGCKACQALCALTQFGENNLKKSALKIIGHFPDPGTYDINICNQCGACATICPVQAISDNGDAYLIDATACIGCGLCVSTCPTRSMVQHASTVVPIKCVSCGACVEYCPRRALVWQEG